MTRLAIDEWRTLLQELEDDEEGAMTRLAIDDMPVEYAKENVAASAQAQQALRRWDAKYPGTSLGQLRELDPTLYEEVCADMFPAQPEKGWTRVSGNVHAEFYVDLERGTLEMVNVSLMGYDPDDFEVDEDLGEEDELRARNIASSLGNRGGQAREEER